MHTGDGDALASTTTDLLMELERFVLYSTNSAHLLAEGLHLLQDVAWEVPDVEMGYKCQMGYNVNGTAWVLTKTSLMLRREKFFS